MVREVLVLDKIIDLTESDFKVHFIQLNNVASIFVGAQHAIKKAIIDQVNYLSRHQLSMFEQRLNLRIAINYLSTYWRIIFSTSN